MARPVGARTTIGVASVLAGLGVSDKGVLSVLGVAALLVTAWPTVLNPTNRDNGTGEGCACPIACELAVGDRDTGAAPDAAARHAGGLSAPLGLAMAMVAAC